MHLNHNSMTNIGCFVIIDFEVPLLCSILGMEMSGSVEIILTKLKNKSTKYKLLMYFSKVVFCIEYSAKSYKMLLTYVFFWAKSKKFEEYSLHSSAIWPNLNFTK